MITKPKVLVTGASGNVGRAVIETLREQYPGEIEAIAAATKPHASGEVEFDFTRAETHRHAFDGIDRMFLLRPPQLSNVSREIAPAIAAAKRAGISYIAFLSLQGVEGQTRTPHYAIEELLRASGIGWTFLRPSFFMQNLSTTHAAEIRDRNEIFVPAGNGKTNFVDARDVGEAAAHMLANPGKHLMRAYDLTGPASFTYDEVAATLSRELGREIRYARPSKVQFLVRKLREKTPLMFTLVMIYLYHQTVTGAADSFSPELGSLLGRTLRTLDEFVRDHRAIWMRR